jgi:hypothetical protein
MKEYRKPLLYVTVFTGGREEVMLVSGNFTKGNFSIGTSRNDVKIKQLDSE